MEGPTPAMESPRILRVIELLGGGLQELQRNWLTFDRMTMRTSMRKSTTSRSKTVCWLVWQGGSARPEYTEYVHLPASSNRLPIETCFILFGPNTPLEETCWRMLVKDLHSLKPSSSSSSSSSSSWLLGWHGPEQKTAKCQDQTGCHPLPSFREVLSLFMRNFQNSLLPELSF